MGSPRPESNLDAAIQQLVSIARQPRRLLRLLRNAGLDLRYGGRLLGGNARSPYFAKGYFDAVNTDYDVLERLFSEIELKQDDVIVDVGCGKGRTLNWFLSRGCPERLIGVEINARIAEFTRDRLRRYPQVEIRTADAVTDFVEGSIYYLFNPFDATAMAAWEKELARRAVTAGPGRPVIVYTRCDHVGIFEARPLWEVQRIDLRSLGYREAAIIRVRRPV